MKKFVMLLFLLCFAFTSFASVKVVKETKEKHKTEQTLVKVVDFQKAVITPAPLIDVGILQKQSVSKETLSKDKFTLDKPILTKEHSYINYRNWCQYQSSPENIPKGFQ